MTTVDNPKVSQPSGKDEDQKEKGFFNRPRAGGKTMWDWLNLLGILAIPLVVGAATIGFGLLQLHLADVQHQNDQQRALDQQQAAILQTYIDNIQDLLLNHNLLGSKPTDDVAILARARTLTALQGLDPERKGLLVQFIYEARLIGFLDSTGISHGQIIDLNFANLSNADLNFANLSNANLSNADLSGASLNVADLHLANLSRADLRFAILEDADLRLANLSGVRLYHADLTKANLLGANNLTQQQLDQVYTCKGAIMPETLTILPKGVTCNHNQ